MTPAPPQGRRITMSWAYRILFPLLLIPALPYYLWRMLRRGGYGPGFSQRLGFFPKLGPKTPGKRRLWIQAVSVGELEAIGPLLRRLQASGAAEIILTTTTSTGYRLAQERYADVADRIGIFPTDLWPCSALAWNRICPDGVILVEGELWPEHLAQARARGVPADLINGRISDKSFARHLRFRNFSAYVRGCGELAGVDAVWLPGDFGFKTCTVADLRGGTPEENIAMFSDLLVGGVSDGLLDTLCLSAGASLWVAGKVADPAAGARRAREIILGGELREQARRLREAYRAD